MGAGVNFFYILHFTGLAAIAFTNIQQCVPNQSRLLTVYTISHSTVYLSCATAPRNTPSHWTCTKFDSDGSVVARETLPPTERTRSIVTYTASEAGVYEIAQIVPRGTPPNCQCKFEVKVNLSAALQSTVLADLDQRYGRLGTADYDSMYEVHTNLNCNRTLCSSGECFTVKSTWYMYRDGELLDIAREGKESPYHAQTGDVSHYVCLTQITLTNGSSVTYVTAQRRVSARRAANAAASVSPSPSPGLLAAQSELQKWEVALISVNAIVLVGLACIVMVSLMVFRRRQTNKRHSRLHEEEQTMEQHRNNDEDQTQRDSIFKDGMTSLETTLSSIVFEELLYKGTFKIVHKASIGTAEVVVKRLRDQSSLLGLSEIKNEEDMLKEIGEHAGGHPNIMSLHPMQVKDCSTCLLLEYAPCGTLDKFLFAIKAGFVPDWYLKSIHQSTEDSYSSHVARDLMNSAVQIAEAMRFLSLRGLVHKDLSTRNAFIYSDFVVKIGNFGQQHEGNYYLVTERGHFLQDMAPECMWHKEYSSKSDVWSFGILLYKLGTLEGVPFPGMELAYLYREMEEGRRPAKQPCFSKKLFFMIQQCWYFTPAERPDFVALLNTLNDMRNSPSQHIILHTFENPAAVCSPAQPQHQDRERGPEPQRRGSGSSSRAGDTVHTVKTAETTVDMLTDEEEEEEEDEEEEEEEVENDEEDEEGEEGEEGSLGPPMMKKLRTIRSTSSHGIQEDKKKHVHVKMSIHRTDSSSEEETSQLVKYYQGQQEKSIANLLGSKSQSVKSKSQVGSTVPYRQSQRHKPNDDLDISPMYADLISKLAPSDSAYP